LDATQRFVVKYKMPDYYLGQYVKLGGGATNDLQKAEVVGWKTKRWDRPDHYELIPVKVVLA
jgi:hypothetical protein